MLVRIRGRERCLRRPPWCPEVLPEHSSKPGDYTFHTKEFITDGNIVVIIGFESGTVNATEKSFRNEWAQKYVVQNGLITEMEEYNIQVDSKA